MMTTDCASVKYSSIGKRVFDIEIEELIKVRNRLNEQFDNLINEILNVKGKVVIIGVGKSGIIAQKIASTLTSTGTPSLFIHGTEAVHGELGLILAGDLVILISNTGNSPEILALLPHLKSKRVVIAAMTGNRNSELTKAVDILIDIGVDNEASSIKCVPTCSTTSTLVMGDAIASVLIDEKGFKEEDYALFHPGGGIGKRLKLKVADLMHPIQCIPFIDKSSSISEVIAALNTRVRDSSIYLGAVLVISQDYTLDGIISLGDIRKALVDPAKFFSMSASEIMNPSPITVQEDESALDALRLMENRELPLLELPAMRGKVVAGFLKIHDILGRV